MAFSFKNNLVEFFTPWYNLLTEAAIEVEKINLDNEKNDQGLKIRIMTW
jgi:hypothetical protein